MSATSPFMASLRRSWPVLVAYGVFSIWGVACFVTSLSMTAGGFGVSAGEIGAVFGVLLATLLGHVAGNLLGLLRLRLAVIVVLFIASLIGSAISGVAIGAFALYLIVGVVAAFGGYLGIASRLDVVASWVPLSFSVAGAMIWMNAHDAIHTFRAGHKYALWDPFTLICLGGAVFLNLVFLASRHSLSLTVWQEVARPAAATASPDDAVAVAKPGRGSLIVLLVFSFVVLAATAFISPYLFRTAESDGGERHASSKDDSGKGEPSKGRGDGKSRGGGSGRGSGDGSGKGEGSGKGKGKGKGKGSGSGRGDSAGRGDGSGRSDGSGKGDGDGSGKGNGNGQGDGTPGGSGDGDPSEPLSHPDTEGAGETGSAALAMGMRLMGWLLAIALAIFMLMIVVFAPMRRAFLLRHLERPIWPVSPTTRVINLWRRALAALAIVDVGPAAGETPRAFARRATTELEAAIGAGAPGLEEAAAIVERVDYAGRGLGGEDERTMREAVTAVVQAVAQRAGAKRRVAAAWGPPPDIES